MDDVYEAVGELLLDSVSSSSEEEITGFCALLYSMLHGGDEDLEDGSVNNENKLLDVPVQLSSMLRIGLLRVTLKLAQSLLVNIRLLVLFYPLLIQLI